MKKYFVYALALSLVAFVAPRAFAKGSLAIGHGEAYGWAVNMHSFEESDHAALEHCGNDCKIVYHFNGTCAAYAKDGPGGATGWAHGPTREDAERLARAECITHGGHTCEIRVWGCDTD